MKSGEFSNDLLTVVADSAETSDTIDVSRAQNAKERAEARIAHAQDDKNDAELARARVALMRAVNRIHVAGITVQIVTPVGEIYNEPNVDLAIVNTQGGQIGVMKKHVPLLAALTIDELIIKKGDQREVLAVNGGIAHRY
ncbi:hypothetical protein GQS40_12250|uniref:ATP synthase epsilon chain n=1 Tax=Leuconostoc lactis TaxID=1246 RepID=A0A6L7AE28_LEULA|nr:hypothetical protein [Leuconostoc lactis]